MSVGQMSQKMTSIKFREMNVMAQNVYDDDDDICKICPIEINQKKDLVFLIIFNYFNIIKIHRVVI